MYRKTHFESHWSDKLTDCSLSSSGGHQQHQKVLNDVRLELVQVSGPVTLHGQINLQTEALFSLEAGPLGTGRERHTSHAPNRRTSMTTGVI